MRINSDEKFNHFALVVKAARAFLRGKEVNNMNMEDLMEQMICERIEILMKRQPKAFMEKNRELLKRQEAVIGNLDRETRIAMENLIDDLIAQTAEENRYLYLAGIEDGMKIAKIVLKAWGE